MAYIGTSPANGVRRKHTYTATAGQTSFSGADDNNVTLTYVDTEYLDVYQNGVKLVAVSDYASTTGTSVVLVQGASVDDTVEIIVFDVFSVADTVSAGSGGSFGGNIGIGGTLAVTGTSTLTGVLTANGGAVFNEGGADVDFRVESDTIDHALFVNGATGDVGINTNLTPSSSSAGSRFLTVAGSTDGILQLTKNGSGGGALASAGGAGMIFYSHTGTVGSETYTERGRIHSDGAVTFNQRVSINSSTKPSSSYAMRLQIASGTGGMIIQKVSTALNYAINFLKTDGASIGTITLTETATAFNTSSDYRLKENVDYTFDATTRLKQLKPARFNFIADADKTVDGFLAHEVSSIVPEAIHGTKDATKDITNVVLNADGVVKAQGISQEDWTQGKSDEIYASDTTWVASKTVPDYQGIDQSKLVPLLVKTIQELEARITALENA